MDRDGRANRTSTEQGQGQSTFKAASPGATCQDGKACRDPALRAGKSRRQRIISVAKSFLDTGRWLLAREARTYRQANGKTLRTWPDVSAKLLEMRARVRGERPDVSSSGKVRGIERMINLDDGSSFPSGVIKAPYLNAASLPYGEAQVHYLPEHILGVYTELLSQQQITAYQQADNSRTAEVALQDAVEAIQGALDLRFYLKTTCKLAVPLVEYSLGAVTLHASPKALMKAAAAKCPSAIIEAVKEKIPVGMHGDDA